MSESNERDRKDIVLLHSPTESGDGIRVIRQRDDSIEVGELRAMREGQPIHGDVVRLTPREDHARLFDCEVLVPREATSALPPAAPRRDAPAPRALGPAKSPGAEAKAPEKDAAPPPERPLGHKGPARVTTEAYRGGWDLIFGGKRGGGSDSVN